LRRYFCDANIRPGKNPTQAEVLSRASWEDYYNNRNLDKASVKWCKAAREAIMKGEVLEDIRRVRRGACALQPLS
jgi:hypothetical protein